jgi:hypothetical protein
LFIGIPIWRNNQLIGAIGMLIFEGVSELYRILKNATKSPADQLGKQNKQEESSTQIIELKNHLKKFSE